MTCDTRLRRPPEQLRRPPEQRTESARALMDVCAEASGFRIEQIGVEITQHAGVLQLRSIQLLDEGCNSVLIGPDKRNEIVTE